MRGEELVLTIEGAMLTGCKLLGRASPVIRGEQIQKGMKEGLLFAI